MRIKIGDTNNKDNIVNSQLIFTIRFLEVGVN